MGIWSTQMIQIKCIVKLALIRSKAQSSTEYKVFVLV